VEEKIVIKLYESFSVFLFIIFVGASIPFIAVTYNLPSVVEPESQFQRSGSITIFFIIFAEIHLLRIRRKYEDTRMILESPLGQETRDIRDEAISLGLAILSLLSLAGTIIWGYGDLIYKHIF